MKVKIKQPLKKNIILYPQTLSIDVDTKELSLKLENNDTTLLNKLDDGSYEVDISLPIHVFEKFRTTISNYKHEKDIGMCYLLYEKENGCLLDFYVSWGKPKKSFSEMIIDNIVSLFTYFKRDSKESD